MRRGKTTKLKPKPTRSPAPKGVKSLGSLGDGKRVLEIEARAVQALWWPTMRLGGSGVQTE